jgi:hypothetical protein
VRAATEPIHATRGGRRRRRADPSARLAHVRRHRRVPLRGAAPMPRRVHER